MTVLKRILLGLLLAITLFINAHKPSDHEQLAESPTEIIPYVNGYDAIYTQYLKNERQHAELERKIKRKQALEEAQRIYDIRQAQRKVAQQKQISRSGDVKLTQYEATAYIADCRGCVGITSSGYDVTSTQFYGSYRVLAADKTIPFYTKMEVRLSNGRIIYGIVLDRGGAITKGKIDILVRDVEEANKIGRQLVSIRILN